MVCTLRRFHCVILCSSQIISWLNVVSLQHRTKMYLSPHISSSANWYKLRVPVYSPYFRSVYISTFYRRTMRAWTDTDTSSRIQSHLVTDKFSSQLFSSRARQATQTAPTKVLPHPSAPLLLHPLPVANFNCVLATYRICRLRFIFDPFRFAVHEPYTITIEVCFTAYFEFLSPKG